MSTRYYEPPEPINKPQKTMKLRYVGETFWPGDGLTNGQVYEAWVDPDSGMYRVIDDSRRRLSVFSGRSGTNRPQLRQMAAGKFVEGV